MRSRWCWCAASWLVALPLAAAVVPAKAVRVELADDGYRLEVALQVEIEDPAELADWSPYTVYLDEHRRLEKLSAWVQIPGRGRAPVAAEEQDEIEWADAGILHGSQRFRVVRFPPLPAGSVLGVSYALAVEPYFPAAEIRLGEMARVDRLDVEVVGKRPDWRYTLSGAAAGLEVSETSEGIEITGSLEANRPDGPEGAALRLGWGEQASWRDVGLWYERLLDPVERRPAAVAAASRTAAAGFETPRQRLDALLGWVREQVRYVAVEVGIGGYRPSSPGEVLDRKWGDCKDKSLLLIDLLREQGIEALPVLILASAEDRLDAEFVSPGQFNHLIVAVVAEQLETTATDPVAEGLLFVDPTLDPGVRTWLHPDTQGQPALVVRGAESRLVTTPVLPGLESRWVEGRFTLSERGGAEGTIRIELAGGAAAGLATLASAEDRRGAVEAVVGALLPQADLSNPRWGIDTVGGPPKVLMQADLRIPLLVAGGARGSFVLPGWEVMPETAELDGIETVAAQPSTSRATWLLEPPLDWCPPDGGDHSVANEAGSFEQRVRSEDGTIRVDRVGELRLRWVEPAQHDAARELALAERRALKRRIRLRCP